MNKSELKEVVGDKTMKPGDYTDVHFPEECKIGRLLSDDGDMVTVEFDNAVCEEIPKELCTLWVAV